MTTKPVLLTTVHDPHGKLLADAHQQLAILANLYTGMVIEATTTTDYRLKGILYPFGMVSYAPPGDIGTARRRLLKSGIRYFYGRHFHLCDFDRLLHWRMRWPEELQQVLKDLPEYDFTVLGRTERAMGTHPFLQRTSEQFINRVMWRLFQSGPLDALTASRGISYRLAEYLCSTSQASGPAGVDVEWPILAAGLGPVAYIATEGLEYESDTFQSRRGSLTETRVRLLNVWQAVRIMARLHGTENSWRGDFSGERPRPATHT